MFINNKYYKIYYNIIDNARTQQRTGYIEKHHIIPRSFGGPNSKENIVKLTFKEHFICHRLLSKFTQGKYKRKMLVALWCIARKNKLHITNRFLISREYEICRRACSEAASLYRHSDESKNKISLANKGKPKSLEHRINIGLSSKGRIWSNESKAKKAIQVGGVCNPRALAWKTIFENGNELIVTSLKSWCRENKIPLWPFYDIDYKNNFYKGIKVTKLLGN